jgi:hypothetical protein
MAQNFLACDRDQELLLPPSLREWLSDGHRVWCVIDAVAALDLRPFYAVYRDNGQGRAAHDPAMMVALLLYSYAIGERSSRGSRGAALRTLPRVLSAPTRGRITRRSRASVHATRLRWRAVQ